jgi:hypothetical protein
MVAEIKSRAQIASDAMQAAAAGESLTANPYPAHTDAYTAWRKAWADFSAVTA